ncbi:SDR family oxidoreductase [Methylobacillus caricis]|uniref:UDP-glucose 4-epimerase family protein n=1 Tax=Methylobacillus caricis TaxID=1971611 RepID=UPI001CFF6E35|nr:SDR family oxidoreductase [Methylobacillus caricis]MCB5187687.1 SDR family oxidoreductase [Methylobacillus caricis]
MNKLLITGGTGFVGHRLLQQLNSRSVSVISAGRQSKENTKVIDYVVDEIDRSTAWLPILTGVNVIIHLAARVHVMQDEHHNPLKAFRETNVKGTINLARQAASAGVKRFIFVSSIKVNGEQTLSGRPYTTDSAAMPQDAYGISKYEAEQQLLALAKETGMEVVVIRPPLVYGPGVKGNFASLMKWARAGIPLPLGAIHNRRSLVAVDNLVSLMITCIDHPFAANQIFLVSDGEDMSTSDLSRRLAKAAGASSRLIPVPAGLLKVGLTVLGKRMIAQRLLGSLQVDISKTREVLGWTPPISVDEGLRRCFSVKD